MADLNFDCPECSHNLIVDAQAAGLVVACPECGTQIRVPALDAETGIAGEPVRVAVSVTDESAASEPVPAPEMSAAALEYRVVGLIDGDGSAGQLTAEVVEFKLNELQQEGWRLCSATTIQTQDAQDKPRQELLLILERKG